MGIILPRTGHGVCLFLIVVPRLSDFGWRICAVTIRASASIHLDSYTDLFILSLNKEIILPGTYHTQIYIYWLLE